MGEMIVSLAGTEAGELLALALALLSALAHATFGAIHKGGRDPYLNRGAINVAYSLMAMPFALFYFPLPTGSLWAILAGVYVIHIVYEWLQARSYEIGGFTVVYPIARGTGPLVTVIIAYFLFGESFENFQWLGLLLLTGSIYGLAWANMRAQGFSDLQAAKQLRLAIGTAILTGVMIAVYTLWDAYGIRQAENPFTFLAWFFTIGGFGFPLIAFHRWRKMPVEARPALDELAIRGIFGAFIAFLSFGAVMLATRLDKVGEAAALRETSIVFATALGVLIFREKIDLTRLGLIFLIAFGAILIELG